MGESGSGVIFPVHMEISRRRQLVPLAIAAFVLAYGTHAAGQAGEMHVPMFGHLPSTTFSYVAIAAGLALGIGALQSLLTGRPALDLTIPASCSRRTSAPSAG